MAVVTNAGVGKSDPLPGLEDRRHPFQVDLVHNAVSGGDHVHILESPAGPFDEVEAVLVAAILDGPVLLEGQRCSRMWAAQPGVRAMTNNGVNMAVGTPIMG